MNVFKPLQASLLYKVFEWEGKQRLAVSVLFGFPLEGGEPLMESDLWAMLPAEIGSTGILDLCMPKPNGEVMIYGNYYSPGGQPVSADTVEFKIGTISKQLMVFGDRYWRALIGPTEPEAFSVMPLDYLHAFGGKGFAKNPLGKGIEEVDVFGEKRLPLPNIENPKAIMTSSGQRPDPAGFAPLDVSWELRSSKLGTYDDRWLKERAPEYAKDLDWNHFNAAPPDQWVDGFFTGEEVFELRNMHPEKRIITGQLPGFRVRCFIDRSTEEFESSPDEITMHAETVWFLPHIETGIVLYRGVVEIQTDDASDIDNIMVAYENLNNELRTKGHYEKALRNRLDPEIAHLYMMDTTDLIPDGATCGYASASGLEPSYEQNILKKQKEEEEDARQEMQDAIAHEKLRISELFTSLGVDPSPFLAKIDSSESTSISNSWIKERLNADVTQLTKKSDLTADDLKNIEELVTHAEDMSKDRELIAKGMLKTLYRHIEPFPETGVIKEKIAKAIDKKDEKPPFPRPPVSEVTKKFIAEQESTQLMTTDSSPETIDKEENENTLILGLSDAGKEIRDSYRMQAHHIEKGIPPHKVSLDVVREFLLDQVNKRQPVSGGDFCCVDLSHQDLSGIDLSGCYLENVNLTSATLVNANLEGAILAFSNLTRCDLSGANLKNANLGAATLIDAKFVNADMSNSQLGKSNLSGADFSSCDLTDADFTESKLVNAVFSQAKLPYASFVELDMSMVKFEKTELIGSEFINCNLTGANFSSANLEESSWIASNLDGANFTGAQMFNTRFPGGTTLRGACFVGAMLDTANLRDTILTNADFTQASLNMSDFGDAKAENAVFRSSVAKSAQFIGTDLAGADLSEMNIMEGSLMKARLTRAKLLKANCHGVEFMKATVGDTDFSGTILSKTKLENWRP